MAVVILLLILCIVSSICIQKVLDLDEAFLGLVMDSVSLHVVSVKLFYTVGYSIPSDFLLIAINFRIQNHEWIKKKSLLAFLLWATRYFRTNVQAFIHTFCLIAAFCVISFFFYTLNIHHELIQSILHQVM